MTAMRCPPSSWVPVLSSRRRVCLWPPWNSVAVVRERHGATAWSAWSKNTDPFVLPTSKCFFGWSIGAPARDGHPRPALRSPDTSVGTANRDILRGRADRLPSGTARLVLEGTWCVAGRRRTEGQGRPRFLAGSISSCTGAGSRRPHSLFRQRVATDAGHCALEWRQRILAEYLSMRPSASLRRARNRALPPTPQLSRSLG